jgi:peptide/nickel transport system ATP-binding protein
MNPPALLSVTDLTVDFGSGLRAFRAVDGASLAIQAGQTVGLVGESGSGKSTIGRAIVGLTPPTGGSIVFDGQDITAVSPRSRRKLGTRLQMVFQDPHGSFNPARTVGEALAEPLLAQSQIPSRARPTLISEALQRVGLPADTVRRYPAQLSGGQRQRVAIARALVNSPRLVVCDEPLSALDLSIQAQILNLLSGLQLELGLSYLFISHDLAVVRQLSHFIVVLYHGQVMESGPAETVCSRPVHPYTRALLAATPVTDPTQARAAAALRQRSVTGSATNLHADPAGCRFAARCPFVIEACTRQRPPLVQTRHQTSVACLRHHELQDLPYPDASASTARTPAPTP